VFDELKKRWGHSRYWTGLPDFLKLKSWRRLYARRRDIETRGGCPFIWGERRAIQQAVRRINQADSAIPWRLNAMAPFEDGE